MQKFSHRRTVRVRGRALPVGGTRTGGCRRLEFAELYWATAGKRLFNLATNGTSVRTKFDVFATAGGKDRATKEVFTAKADLGGKITLQFTSVMDNAKRSGFQVTLVV